MSPGVVPGTLGDLGAILAPGRPKAQKNRKSDFMTPPREPIWSDVGASGGHFRAIFETCFDAFPGGYGKKRTQAKRSTRIRRRARVAREQGPNASQQAWGHAARASLDALAVLLFVLLALLLLLFSLLSLLSLRLQCLTLSR